MLRCYIDLFDDEKSDDFVIERKSVENLDNAKYHVGFELIIIFCSNF